jgi:diacylglycerol O-acyltransferase / trehalose O-mycolyltransferase
MTKAHPSGSISPRQRGDLSAEVRVHGHATTDPVRRPVTAPGRATQSASRGLVAAVEEERRPVEARVQCWLTALGSVVRRSTAAIVVVLVLVCTAACSGGQETSTAGSDSRQPTTVTTTVLSPRMRDLTIDSVALGRAARVRLLLPNGYESRPDAQWPVLYLLHGCCDTYESWTRSTDVEQLTERSDLIVVMPDGGRAGFYSDWLDGPGWETFHLTELRRVLERDYGARAEWAIGGVSMGGLGALAYAARHPGMFKAAASFSGITHTRSSPGAYLRLLRGEGEQPEQLWGDPTRQADVWAAHNPYDLAPKLVNTLLFLSVGTGQPGPLDPPNSSFDSIESSLAKENAALAERLRELNIPAQTDFYGPGTHSWPYWQRELHVAWPMIQQALGLI